MTSLALSIFISRRRKHQEVISEYEDAWKRFRRYLLRFNDAWKLRQLDSRYLTDQMGPPGYATPI